jgi:hypothetical protein
MRFPSPSLLASVRTRLPYLFRSMLTAANSRGDLNSECPYRVTGFDAIQDIAADAFCDAELS